MRIRAERLLGRRIAIADRLQVRQLAAAHDADHRPRDVTVGDLAAQRLTDPAQPRGGEAHALGLGSGQGMCGHGATSRISGSSVSIVPAGLMRKAATSACRTAGRAGRSLMLSIIRSASGCNCAAVPCSGQNADRQANLRRAAHGEIVRRIADHGDLAGLQADSLAERQRHAGVGLGAVAGVEAGREIEQIEDAGAPQRCLQPADRIVGGNADAQPAPLERGERTVHAWDQHGMLGPALGEQRDRGRVSGSPACAPRDARRTHRRSRQCCRPPAASRRPPHPYPGPGRARAAAPPPAPHRPTAACSAASRLIGTQVRA